MITALLLFEFPNNLHLPVGQVENRIHEPKCFQTVHSPLFSREIFVIYRVLPLMAAVLIFKCTEGAGVGDYTCSPRGRGQTAPRLLSSFDTHPRWHPVTHSARSRRSYGKIGDCEQSKVFHEYSGLYRSRARVKVIIFIQQGGKVAADATHGFN